MEPEQSACILEMLYLKRRIEVQTVLPNLKLGSQPGYRHAV